MVNSKPYRVSPVPRDELWSVALLVLVACSDSVCGVCGIARLSPAAHATRSPGVAVREGSHVAREGDSPLESYHHSSSHRNVAPTSITGSASSLSARQQSQRALSPCHRGFGVQAFGREIVAHLGRGIERGAELLVERGVPAEQLPLVRVAG